ncbi:MAG: aminotransferase class IV [Planctomycetota bacterium]|jgi:branched-chain amino acid aminotransferase|nr:aminotransferase class IV [Planctomycetota bacterium]
MLQPRNPANDGLIVNINGHLVHRNEAAVSPFDSSVQNGDAVWEGLRLYEGRIFRLDDHLARLRKSGRMLAYRDFPTNERLIEELRRTLVANAMHDGVHVRLTVSRGVKYTSGLDPRVNQSGCSFFILAEHKPPVFDNANGIHLMTSSQRRPYADILDQHIHSCNQLTSILAKLEANASGADDAVLLDTAGMLAETSSTHLFLVRDGQVITSTTRACPEGITRSVVLEICREINVTADVRDVPANELPVADEMFVTGTMGEITPVARFDDRVMPSIPGPVTAKIAERFRQRTHDPAEGMLIVDT